MYVLQSQRPQKGQPSYGPDQPLLADQPRAIQVQRSQSQKAAQNSEVDSLTSDSSSLITAVNCDKLLKNDASSICRPIHMLNSRRAMCTATVRTSTTTRPVSSLVRPAAWRPSAVRSRCSGEDGCRHRSSQRLGHLHRRAVAEASAAQAAELRQHEQLQPVAGQRTDSHKTQLAQRAQFP